MSVGLMGALASAFLAGGALGGVVAWWAHRRTRLSPWNFYVAVPLGLLAWLAALATRRLELLPVVGFFGSASVVAASMARRYRLSALGAGGELREFERSRRMLWTTHKRRRAGAQLRSSRGERTRIEGQGELVRERDWLGTAWRSARTSDAGMQTSPGSRMRTASRGSHRPRGCQVGSEKAPLAEPGRR